ncbi:hypothetical protein HWV62_29410 [Athelia sp. TMB]|nr:hypothetical protein HWV62_29410 [Athelia sp. TMB]
MHDIVRILFMVPIYAVVSFASYLFWDHSTALLLIRDGYESTVLTSFFYLLLNYLSPNPDEQKIIFRAVGISQHADREAIKAGKPVRKWMLPLGWVKKKPADGLYFLQMMKWGVLQYCVVRPTTTLAAVILNYIGWYCESSWSPVWGYVYIEIVVTVSVSVAMYCLIQMYVTISGHLAPHKPLLKLFAIKAVVFLTFWQSTLLSLLSSFGVVKASLYMTAEDVNTGISAILECFEMMLFAFLHLRAFTYRPYVLPDVHLRTPRLRSLGHAFDFRETFREIGAGCVYLVDRMKGREARVDIIARRAAVFEDTFGQERPRPVATLPTLEYGLMQEKPPMEVQVLREVNVDVGGERQWLGIGDDYGYGLAYASRREKDKSDGLGEAIEKELGRRRAGGNNTRHSSEDGSSRPRSSWWRDVYNRLSQSGPDSDEPERPTASLLPHGYEYDDAPPPSIIQTYRIRNAEEARALTSGPIDADVLGPLPASPLLRKDLRNNASTPAVERSDSLLARVFPHTSLTDLAPSESTHTSGNIQVKNVGMGQVPSSVVVTSGNNPGRVLMRSPEPGHLPGVTGIDDARPRTSGPQKTRQQYELPADVIPPVHTQPRRQQTLPLIVQQRTVQQHAPLPEPTDRRVSGSSRVRQSAAHRASQRLTASVPSGAANPSLPQHMGRPANGDAFDPMSLYLAAQRHNAQPPSRERRHTPALPTASSAGPRPKRSPFTRAPTRLSIPAPLAPIASHQRTTPHTANPTHPISRPAPAHYNDTPPSEIRTDTRR